MGLKHLTTNDQDSWDITGSQKIASGAILSPAQITANTDNYDPTGFRVSSIIVKSVLRLDLDANREMTGIVPSSPAEGNEITITNISNFNLKLKNNDAGSTAANRFLLKADITIESGESYTLYYDTTSLRWRPKNSV